jgi:hypothetical protein
MAAGILAVPALGLSAPVLVAGAVGVGAVVYAVSPTVRYAVSRTFSDYLKQEVATDASEPQAADQGQEQVRGAEDAIRDALTDPKTQDGDEVVDAARAALPEVLSPDAVAGKIIDVAEGIAGELRDLSQRQGSQVSAQEVKQKSIKAERAVDLTQSAARQLGLTEKDDSRHFDRIEAARRQVAAAHRATY